MAIEEIPGGYEALIATIDREVAQLRSIKDSEYARITGLDAEQTALGHHPNYAAYRHGGLLRGMGVAHILAHAGFYRLCQGEAVARLAEARYDTGADCLIVALAHVCESDPLLEVAGLAWLDGHGLLKHGALDPFWMKRPKLGLGQPAKLHGLGAADADAHRGLYTLAPAELRRRFRHAARSSADTFGDLLPGVIAGGGAELAATGAVASEQDAADRYWTRCASFAAHQRATGDRRWRWKPPLSRQGHHARTIAELKEVAMPAEQTRGHAANWLDDNGANPRFRQD